MTQAPQAPQAPQEGHDAWRVAAALVVAPTLDEQLRLQLEAAPRISGADAAAVYLRDERGGWRDVARFGHTKAHFGTPRPGGTTERVFASRRPLVVSDTAHDGRVHPAVGEAGVRSLVALPLLVRPPHTPDLPRPVRSAISAGEGLSTAGGEIAIGVLYVDSSHPCAFGAAAVAALEGLAAMAAAAIHAHSLTEQLERLYEEIQRTVQQRDELIASAAHDLKNPLSAIKGRTQILRRLLARPEPPRDRLADGLAKIEAVVDGTVGQVDEMLDVAHLQTGQDLALRPEPTDLVALVRQVAERHVTEAHTIRVDSDEPALVGSWDPARLERVLGNLLSNAVKYSPEGGEVVVTVRREPGEQRAQGEHDEGGSDRQEWATVAVRDHGLGIPAADLPRIFEPFHRSSNVVGKIRGTGLGLAAARRIVEQHGGAITVESREPDAHGVGGGSTFTVRLPVTAPEG